MSSTGTSAGAITSDSIAGNGSDNVGGNEAAGPSLDSRTAIAIVTRREVSTRIMSRPFVVGIAVTVGMIFGVFGLGSLLAGDDPLRIGLVGPQPDGARQAVQAVAEFGDTELTFETFTSRAQAEAAALDGGIDAAVLDGSELIMRETEDDIVALLAPAYQQVRLAEELGTSGLNSGEIDGAFAAAAQPLTVVELEPDPDRDARERVAFASVILLFVAVQVAGAYIMLGVFEEKSNKVVEIMLSSIKARDLLIGKVIGVGALGIVQVIGLAGSALGAASLFGSSALPALSPGLIIGSVLWFVLGYLLYGSVFAAGASLAPRQEDAQSTLAPVSVLLMLSYFATIFATADPQSLGAKVVSWIPFMSPFAMPGRMAGGDAAVWEVLVAMALTALTAGVMIMIAERIYVRSVIHTDRTLGWREAWSLQS